MTMHRFERVSEIDVAFTEEGDVDGEAVVMVHGLAEDQRSFAAVQNALPEFHTYSYAFRGHGRTSIGDGNGTLAQLGEDLIAFLEGVSGPARCVGYSLGGTIVLWAAAHRPDLIRHIVIAGSSTVVGRAAVGFFKERIDMIERDGAAFARALRSDTEAQLVNSDVDVDAVTAQRLDAVGDGAGYVNAARAMVGVNGSPLTPILEKIVCPVDIIGADGDVFCPKKAADIIMEGLGEAGYHEISNAGHLMSVDQPEAYAAKIREILTGRTM